jgi:hypothetical protein
MRIESGLARRIVTTLTVALLAAIGSCRDMPTAPTPPSNGNDPSHLLGLPIFGGSPRLLYCPSNETQQSTGLIDVAGGTVSLGGTSVTFPLNALLGPTNVKLTIPAGNYMEVDLSAVDSDGQPVTTFAQPVVLTIDYSRCNRLSTLLHVLSVWNIDTETKALLENMGGIDNKLAQTITALTPHFSGFAIAY